MEPYFETNNELARRRQWLNLSSYWAKIISRRYISFSQPFNKFVNKPFLPKTFFNKLKNNILLQKQTMAYNHRVLILESFSISYFLGNAKNKVNVETFLMSFETNIITSISTLTHSVSRIFLTLLLHWQPNKIQITESVYPQNGPCY